MKSLAEIYQSHSSAVEGHGDKGTVHSYVEIYERMLAPFRDLPITLLEIGVGQGHSLRMWREYFSSNQTEIVGIDINPEVKPVEHCEVFNCEAMNFSNLDGIGHILRGRKPSIVIDDGSHQLMEQILSRTILFKYHMAEKGLYFIEDIQNPELDLPIFNRLFPEPRVFDMRDKSKRYDDVLLLWEKSQ